MSSMKAKNMRGTGNPGDILVFVVALEGYANLVPFVEEPDYYFLKTVIPSRKATRDYLQWSNPNETP